MDNVISMMSHPLNLRNKHRTFLQYEGGELKRLTKKFIPLNKRTPSVEVPGKEGNAARIYEGLRRTFPNISRIKLLRAARNSVKLVESL